MRHEDPEALRRRLYRRDATAADVDAYRAAAPAGRPDAPAVLQGAAVLETTAVLRSGSALETGSGDRRSRSRVVAAAGGLALVLAASALAVGSLAPAAEPVAAPIAATGPAVVRFTPAPRDPGEVLDAPDVVDGGVRAHASGAARLGPDAGVVYTVARGDRMDAVAGRFGLCVADVLVALPYGFDPARPPVGQHLLLQRVAGAC